MECKHNWIVEDYDDCDRGCVFVVCSICGYEDKMAEDQETAEYYGVEYLPGATEQVNKLLLIDAEALFKIKNEGKNEGN